MQLEKTKFKETQILTKAIAIIMAFTSMMFMLLGYMVLCVGIAESRYVLPYRALKNYIYLPYDEQIINNIPTREQMRKDINQMFNNPIYFYYEHDFNDDKSLTGYSFIPLKVVIIDTPMLTEQLYAWTLAHELTHITAFTTCERYCNYNAFKVLYESNIPYYVEVAKLIVDIVGNIDDGGEYAFGGYVENYLYVCQNTF